MVTTFDSASERRNSDVASALEAIRCWPTATARSWLQSSLVRMAASPSVLAVVAIGSAVREVDRCQDLDLVVVHDASWGLDAVEGRPIEVDIRGYGAEEVERLLSSGHDLLDWAVRFGVVLHEKSEFWSDLRGRWLTRLPGPSAEVADQRAAKAESILQDLLSMRDEDAAREQLVSLLTHRARAKLIRAGVIPTSRPELASQLRGIGALSLAKILEDSRLGRRPLSDLVAEALEGPSCERRAVS